MDEIDVETINFDTMHVVFSDGTSGPIVYMIDEYGEDTDDADEAFAIVVEHKTQGRAFVDLDGDFEEGDTIQ